MSDYLPIEDYGVIGNMRTAALVGKNGSIDWLCLPHFDSPSVFAAILDKDRGGNFKIAPRNLEDVTYKQFYWPDTNILVSRFLSSEGVAEVQDFMPVGPRGEVHAGRLVRRVQVSRGEVTIQIVCRPGFDYARAEHQTHLISRGGVFEVEGDVQLALLSQTPLEKGEGQSLRSSFTLSQGESATFLLTQDFDQDESSSLAQQQSQELFEGTVRFWRNWISGCGYKGRWRETVRRSALTLKLLTFEPSGAIVAAPTTSLPDRIGGHRNWDFRFTWIRDAAFTLYAFLRLGFTSEAAAFMQWLDNRYRESVQEDGRQPEKGPLQVLYAIDGRKDLEEVTLDHLSGYRDSSPVRIGNSAYHQLQLDIYGELMDSVYLFNKYGTAISYQAWTHLRSLMNWVSENWDRADAGIWEVRKRPRNFTYSKVMCWVALDRALRLAGKRSLPADVNSWRTQRDKIYQQVLSRAWSEDRRSLVQSFENDCLDSSLLIMPLVFFMAPTDPKMLGTIDAIMQPMSQGGLYSDGLVYRWEDRGECGDGIESPEATFNMCSFWLVEALTRAGQGERRKLEEARLLFEQMLGYANHLGLYSEQTGLSGEALGNFPQGFTHLGLISAAYNLDRHLGSEPG